MNVATVLQALVSLLWLIVIGLIVLAVVRASRGRRVGGISTAILALAIAAVVLTSISAGLVFIQPEQRGVVISAVAPEGYRTQALQPGLNWIIPFLETVEIYPIYRQTYTMSIVHTEGDVMGDDSILARTSDGQEVRVDASVIYAIDPEQVIKVHIEWQERYSRDLVRPLSRGVIRDAISQFGVEEVYSSQRLEVTQQISRVMSEKMQDNGLLLVDFVLRNITFSPEYAASVEKKQVAEQEAKQAFYVVEQRKQEAEQARQVAQGRADAVVIQAEGDAKARLIQAEAEAKSLLVISTAVAENPDLIQYLYINKINPSIQTMLLPSEGLNYFYPLPTVGPPASLAPELTPAPTPTPLPTPQPTATP
ncbi:MAG: prohibitin family protein [Anaerolineales bacterium]|nr:prohibitin family protein [Anaerolineales bacterium]